VASVERRRADSRRTRSVHLRHLAIAGMVASHEIQAESYGSLRILRAPTVSHQNCYKCVQTYPMVDQLIKPSTQRHHPHRSPPRIHPTRHPFLSLNLHQRRRHHHNHSHHAPRSHVFYPALLETILSNVRKRHDWRNQRCNVHRKRQRDADR
jgi:hypothetical protein